MSNSINQNDDKGTENKKGESVKDIRNRRKKDTRTQNIILLAVGILAILLIIIAIFPKNIFKKNPGGTDPQKQSEVAGENSKKRDPVQVRQTEKVTEVVVYHDAKDIVFHKSTGKAEVNFENNDNSTNNMQFTIMVGEDRKVIYQSEVITPGNSIHEVNLDVDYELGEYECYVSAESIDIDNGSSFGVTYTRKLFVEE